MNEKLQDDVRVLVRVYATDTPDLVQRITLTTNSQNRITDRDLRANDRVQVDIQKVKREKYQYLYERKNKEYRALRWTPLSRPRNDEKK